MNMLINCPNCGAPLTSDGYCNYCKTKVRYANSLEIISNDIMRMPAVEILLKFKKGDTLSLIPFVGHVDELQISYNDTTLYCDNSPYAVFDNNPTVRISFTGGIGSVPDEEMKHIKIYGESEDK